MSEKERWSPGTELPARSHMVTLESLRGYAAASGDYNPIHTDPGFAATTPFERPIAHGMLLLAYVMEMLTTTFGANWVTAGRLKVRFRKPAYVNSAVAVWGTVKKVDGETGRLQLTVGCRDEDGNDLVTGSAEVTPEG